MSNESDVADEVLELIGALISETDTTEDALCELMAIVINTLENEKPNIGLALSGLRQILTVTRASQGRRRKTWETFSRRLAGNDRVM